VPGPLSEASSISSLIDFSLGKSALFHFMLSVLAPLTQIMNLKNASINTLPRIIARNAYLMKIYAFRTSFGGKIP
jgi:hypothetical protein